MEQPTDSSKAMQVITVVLLTILVAFAAYFAITVTKGDDTEVGDVKQVQEEVEEEKEDIVVEITDEDIEEVSEEVVEESASQIPDGWRPIENENYGYTAYRPSSWYYSFFGSRAVLGIDSSEIPEASSYVGVVSMSALSGDLESAKDNYTASFLAIAETTETHDNGVWTIVAATVPENLMFPEEQVLAVFIEKGGQTFVVDYRSEASSFSDYEEVFNAFYPAILFD